MKPEHIRIASRGSKLALIQSRYVGDLLCKLCDGLEISIVKISTVGDRSKEDFLGNSESIGLFTSEVERAVLEGRADMAVHSMKDLPTAVSPGLVIAAVPKRQNPADALLSLEHVCSITDLPAGTTVGTSSLRRIAQLRRFNPELKPLPLRGNIETRINKVITGQIDAVVIAMAAVVRLGTAIQKTPNILTLPLKQFIPAPAQGALAVQTRADDAELIRLVSQIDDRDSRITSETERRVLSNLKGGCSLPFGAYSYIHDGSITVDAMVSDTDGKEYIRHSVTETIDNAMMCADKLTEKLIEDGAEQIINRVRK